MGIVSMLGIGAIILLVSQIANSQGTNLLGFGGSMLSQAGNALSTLFGGKTQEQMQEQAKAQATQQQVQNMVTSKEEINKSMAERQDPTQNLQDAVKESTNRYMNGEYENGGFRAYEESRDAEDVANDLYQKGITLKSGEDPTAQLKTDILKTEKEAHGKFKFFSTEQLEAKDKVINTIGNSGIYVYNQDVANQMMTERNAVKQIAVDGDQKFTSKENVEKMKELMPNAYIEGADGSKENADKAIEKALKKLEKDPEVKKALKEYNKDKDNKSNTNTEHNMLTKVTAKFDTYLKEEGVKGNNIVSGAQTQAVAQGEYAGVKEVQATETTDKKKDNHDRYKEQVSISDKKVSKNTQDASKETKDAKGKTESFEQINGASASVKNAAKDIAKEATQNGKDTVEDMTH